VRQKPPIKNHNQNIGEMIMVMSKTNRLILIIVLATVLSVGLIDKALSQPECMAWGNLTGIRVEGQLIEFESSLCLIGSDLTQVTQTAKEQQRPEYRLEGNRQTIKTSLGDISFVETVEGIGDGKALLNVEAKAEQDTTISGAFFCLELPPADLTDVTIELIDSTASTIKPIPAFQGSGRWRRFNRNLQASAKGARIITQHSKIEVMINEATEILVQRGNRFLGSFGNTRIYFGVIPGAVKQGQTAKKTLTIKASGHIDKTPIQMSMDATKPGRVFDGIGGNFRLQNPGTDPQVIDYCLDNLPVVWARVEMPWSNWHPVESVNPIQAARAGKIHPSVNEAMRMAQRLARKNNPIILSAWRAPSWAITGEMSFRSQGGLRGNPLNPAKMKSIVKSITSYILYLKEAYGVEAELFSFNESDLGINVRQTGEEHADLIRSLGASMASRGLETKMLLGDNSDATTYAFITPAMEDPETHEYIGAISFHSWRGCDDWTLSIWADAAKELNIPLLVGEGSTDAAAHGYPDIFLQQAFSLNEIDMYLRIASICQVRSILQWQLTADYSILTGDSIYNTKGKVRPTQRFWNLKQFGLTPSGSFYLPLRCDGPNVSCVAFGDIASGVYSIHMVNNGATRQVTLSGLPDCVKQLRIYSTDHKRGMEEGKRVQVEDGAARFTLDSVCFASLISEQ
jgi:hypothetical protein